MGGLHTGAATGRRRRPGPKLGQPERSDDHRTAPSIRWLRRKKAAAVVVRPDGFVYAASQSGQPLPATPGHHTHTRTGVHRMTTANLTEHTVTVNGKPIFVAETGSGPAVVMLHGGGPGASGVSNYSRNIDALAAALPGHRARTCPATAARSRASTRHDPFGYLADMIRGLLDELGIDTAHLIGNSYGGAAALRLALDTPHRVDKLVLMGPGGIGTTRGVPTAGLKSLLSYYGGDGPSREKLRDLHPHIPCLRRRCGARRSDRVCAIGHRSIPRWWPTRRCGVRRARPRCARCGGWTSPATAGSSHCDTPTLVMWGRDDKVNRPAGGPMLLNPMPNADLLMTSPTPGTGCSGSGPSSSTNSSPQLPERPSRVLAHRLTVFGNVHLGYIVIETEKFADWRRFGRDAIGMHVDETLAPTSCDSAWTTNECRFLLRRGPAEDVTALGWQLDDHMHLRRDRRPRRRPRRARRRGHRRGSRAARGRAASCGSPGPTGSRRRSSPAPVPATAPLDIRAGGGFVTGAGGLGHVAITTKKPASDARLLQHVFDARLSDYIDETISGVKLKIRFLRVNQRHHSVAIAAVNRLPVNPIRTRVQHLNIQVGRRSTTWSPPISGSSELGFHMALASVSTPTTKSCPTTR